MFNYKGLICKPTYDLLKEIFIENNLYEISVKDGLLVGNFFKLTTYSIQFKPLAVSEWFLTEATIVYNDITQIVELEKEDLPLYLYLRPNLTERYYQILHGVLK